jgi:hypothetical protein
VQRLLISSWPRGWYCHLSSWSWEEARLPWAWLTQNHALLPLWRVRKEEDQDAATHIIPFGSREGERETGSRFEARQLVLIGLFAFALFYELALTNRVQKKDLVLLEGAELVRESITFFPFFLLCGRGMGRWQRHGR